MELSNKESVYSKIQESFQALSRDMRDFCIQEFVPERFSTPKATDFYRDWVYFNRPVIFRNAVKHWPAIEKWENDSYIVDKMGDECITVTATPNGYADAIVGDRFVQPVEMNMKYSEFIETLQNPCPERVLYVQKQNSNLNSEFSKIFEDISELSWASEAFNKDFDAVNFWIGDSRAVTSCHKDPYENIYCVVRGYKDIILNPPTDLPWIPYKNCKSAKYKETDTGFEIVDDSDDFVSWIDIDPLQPNLKKYPDYVRTTQLKLRLHAGDVLYLPSLWFHHLRQSHGCIAVNFWYDMEFDQKYSYYNLLNEFVKLRNELL